MAFVESSCWRWMIGEPSCCIFLFVLRETKLVILKYRMSIVNYPAENFRYFVWKLVHFRRLSWKVGFPNVFDCFLDNITASSESRFGKKFFVYSSWSWFILGDYSVSSESGTKIFVVQFVGLVRRVNLCAAGESHRLTVSNNSIGVAVKLITAKN